MLNTESKDNILLIADPVVLAIPIQENHDPLVEVNDASPIAYGPPPIVDDNTDYKKMRKTVYDKLLQAQAKLPDGLSFCLYEGYRSYALQEQIFQDRYNQLKSKHPSMTHEQLFIETTKFASPNINLDASKNVPPHSTGGAIDVYLLDSAGNVVDMGIHLDDTYHDLDGTYCKTDSQHISEQAKAYRQLMGDVLTAVGFINYPTEYWHWSYGDRYWAYHTNQKYAIYGTV